MLKHSDYIIKEKIANTPTNNLPSPRSIRCKKKFLRYFPEGFMDEKFIAWERGYKWEAHLEWDKFLNKKGYKRLLDAKKYSEISNTAARIEGRTNLLFSFEKMALRDAIKSTAGAKAFSIGLYNYVYGTGTLKNRFVNFIEVLATLPRKQTRVLTWPLLTVFGFIANPKEHIFLKPRVTKVAAENYGYEFDYKSKPNWETYQDLLAFSKQIRKETANMKARDFIDIQSYIWVQGSEEYL